MKKLIKYLLIASVMYYLFHGIKIENFVIALEKYSFVWSFIVMFSVILSDFFLTLRWRFLTRGSVSLMASFEAIGISAFLNCILPAKAGEISKIVYLKKFYNFKSTKSTAILFMERIFDILILAIITMITALYLIQIDHAIEYSAIVLFCVVVLFIVLKTMGIKKILMLIPFHKLRLFIFRTFKYTFEISKKRELFGNFVFTILVWISYFLTVYIFLVFVAHFNLSIKEIFIIFVISSVAMSIPLLPGGLGTYQAGVIFALGIYGIEKEEALIVGLLLQLFNTIPSFLVAFYIFEKKEITISSFLNK